MTASQAMFPQAHAADVVPLRDYQIAAHDAIWEKFAAGVRRQLISIATGGGKTYLASHVIRTGRERGFERALFMVHRDELVGQSVRALQNVNPNLSIGVMKAERDELAADIIVVSAPTAAQPKRLARLLGATRGRTLFVSDEAHHDMARGRRQIISEVAPALLVGLTATPNRGDKVGLGALYDEIVFHLPMLDLIALGKLSPLKGLRIDTETELDSVHSRDGDFADGELAEAVDNGARNGLIVESWMKHAAGRRKTVAFCVNVAHAEHLVDAFRAAGVRAEAVFGHTSPEDRRRTLDEFHRGEIPVLVNVMVLSEGYDEPGIDCVLWARPTQSQALYVQAIGRAARVSKEDGKEDALIIDFVDSSSRHRLVTFPSLAGETDEVAEGNGGGSARSGEMVDLLEIAAGNKRLKERAAVVVNLFGSSPYLWRTLDSHYVAPAGRGLWLTLREEGDGYRPYLLMSGTSGAHLSPLFDRALDIETAMGIAETRMDASPLTQKSAGWRQRDEAPSDAQIRYARSLRIRIPAGVTKAELSELIDERTFTRAIALAERSLTS